MGAPGKVAPGAGTLYVCEPDGATFRAALPGVTISNGLAWAPDGQQLAVVNKQDVLSIVDFRRMKVRGWRVESLLVLNCERGVRCFVHPSCSDSLVAHATRPPPARPRWPKSTPTSTKSTAWHGPRAARAARRASTSAPGRLGACQGARSSALTFQSWGEWGGGQCMRSMQLTTTSSSQASQPSPPAADRAAAPLLLLLDRAQPGQGGAVAARPHRHGVQRGCGQGLKVCGHRRGRRGGVRLGHQGVHLPAHLHQDGLPHPLACVRAGCAGVGACTVDGEHNPAGGQPHHACCCCCCCRFSHDSRYLAVAGEEPAIDVENVETGESLGRLALRTAPEDSEWNPRHHMLAFAGEHGRDERGQEFGAVEFRWR